MSAVRSIICWLLIHHFTAFALAKAEEKIVKVFVLAGQSNMEGQAVVDLTGPDYNAGKGTLLSLFERPELIESIRHLRDSDGRWVVRDDVFVSYRRENGPTLVGPLSVGFSVYGDGHHFGPELQFGHVVGDAFDEPVLLIKTAWGGKSLYRDFRPPSAGGDVGHYYQKMIREIRETLAGVNSEFPALAGLHLELAGFVWYQGWNDGVDPKNAVIEYESNLVHLIQDVRKDLNAPMLPFIIGELTGPWVNAPPEWEMLREAQRQAAHNSDVGPLVRFIPTRDFVRESRESPNPTHGHHEFGNAETYFLVGDALGIGYLDLLQSNRPIVYLDLESPSDYQVIQRSSQRSAFVSIRGTTDQALVGDLVFEASYESTDSADSKAPRVWEQFTVKREDLQFSGQIELPEGGWYKLRVRVRLAERIVAESMIPHVGVGEVFVVAGQSNSANHGEERTATKTGLVSMQSGSGWLLAHDPITGASGNGGSFLPHFGDRIAEKFQVPVGLVARGIGATSVREWLPEGIYFPNPPTIESRVRRTDDRQWESDGTAYHSLRKVVEVLGPSGFRAVLWHQGESDANQRDASRTLQGDLYTRYLTTIIEGIRDDAKWPVPWFVAQASYHTPDDPGSDEIRNAQLAVARSGIALQGPDSDKLQGDYRDQSGRGVHFSAKGLRAHGDLWFEKVAPWIESELN